MKKLSSSNKIRPMCTEDSWAPVSEEDWKQAGRELGVAPYPKSVLLELCNKETDIDYSIPFMEYEDFIRHYNLGPTFYHSTEIHGQGTFSTVRKTKDIAGNDIAVKVTDGINSFIQEFNITVVLIHPCIMRPIHWTLHYDSITNIVIGIVAMPFGISITEALYTHQITAEDMLCDLTSGIEFMNRHGIAHLDIKPDNIIFNPITKRAQHIDVGISLHTELCSYTDERGVEKTSYMYDTTRVYGTQLRDPEILFEMENVLHNMGDSELPIYNNINTDTYALFKTVSTILKLVAHGTLDPAKVYTGNTNRFVVMKAIYSNFGAKLDSVVMKSGLCSPEFCILFNNISLRIANFQSERPTITQLWDEIKDKMNIKGAKLSKYEGILLETHVPQQPYCRSDLKEFILHELKSYYTEWYEYISRKKTDANCNERFRNQFIIFRLINRVLNIIQKPEDFKKIQNMCDAIGKLCLPDKGYYPDEYEYLNSNYDILKLILKETNGVIYSINEYMYASTITCDNMNEIAVNMLSCFYDDRFVPETLESDSSTKIILTSSDIDYTNAKVKYINYVKRLKKKARRININSLTIDHLNEWLIFKHRILMDVGPDEDPEVREFLSAFTSYIRYIMSHNLIKTKITVSDNPKIIEIVKECMDDYLEFMKGIKLIDGITKDMKFEDVVNNYFDLT